MAGPGLADRWSADRPRLRAEPGRAGSGSKVWGQQGQVALARWTLPQETGGGSRSAGRVATIPAGGESSPCREPGPSLHPSWAIHRARSPGLLGCTPGVSRSVLVMWGSAPGPRRPGRRAPSLSPRRSAGPCSGAAHHPLRRRPPGRGRARGRGEGTGEPREQGRGGPGSCGLAPRSR